jgi:hypothetical protein
MQGHHGLHLAAEHQLLLGSQQLMAADFSKESAQGAGHDPSDPLN